ncbi:unnamed protein product [Amoebophrya sp. A25]|nr:unnamed protein product [Amoebophrya sp. A25]|eukprot:GSA25T00015495001.1
MLVQHEYIRELLDPEKMVGGSSSKSGQGLLKTHWAQDHALQFQALICGDQLEAWSRVAHSCASPNTVSGCDIPAWFLTEFRTPQERYAQATEYRKFLLERLLFFAGFLRRGHSVEQRQIHLRWQYFGHHNNENGKIKALEKLTACITREEYLNLPASIDANGNPEPGSAKILPQLFPGGQTSSTASAESSNFIILGVEQRGKKKIGLAEILDPDEDESGSGAYSQPERVWQVAFHLAYTFPGDAVKTLLEYWDYHPKLLKAAASVVIADAGARTEQRTSSAGAGVNTTVSEQALESVSVWKEFQMWCEFFGLLVEKENKDNYRRSTDPHGTSRITMLGALVSLLDAYIRHSLRESSRQDDFNVARQILVQKLNRQELAQGASQQVVAQCWDQECQRQGREAMEAELRSQRNQMEQQRLKLLWQKIEEPVTRIWTHLVETYHRDHYGWYMTVDEHVYILDAMNRLLLALPHVLTQHFLQMPDVAKIFEQEDGSNNEGDSWQEQQQEDGTFSLAYHANRIFNDEYDDQNQEKWRYRRQWFLLQLLRQGPHQFLIVDGARGSRRDRSEWIDRAKAVMDLQRGWRNDDEEYRKTLEACVRDFQKALTLRPASDNDDQKIKDIIEETLRRMPIMPK